MPVSVSVVMPAHKEAGNLDGAVRYVTENMAVFVQEGKVTNWEIIIVDSLEPDGSSDGTPELADKLASENQHVRVIHNQTYVNLGFKYKQGLVAARFDYFMMVPGKNTLHGDSLKNLFDCLECADIVIGYQADMSRRPLKRRLISKAFTVFMNLVFSLRLRYYNGTTIIPTRILRELNPDANDFAYMAEILVMLLKKYRLSYMEAPFYTRGRRKYGQTNATKIGNVISVAKTVLKLIKTVYIPREIEMLKSTLREVITRLKHFIPWLPYEERFRFYEVEAGKLYRSSQPTPEALSYFAQKYGINSVVVLRKHIYDRRFDRVIDKLGVLHIPVSGRAPSDNEMNRFLEFVSSKSNQPVLVHCLQGRDRTGCSCFVYRVEVMGWSARDAWHEMKKLGYCNLPWHSRMQAQIDITKWLEERYAEVFN